jgi:hypothetical protein
MSDLKNKGGKSLEERLKRLPDDVLRNRIVPTDEAAALRGVSVRQWRRMKAAGRTPPPIKIGLKKEGYRLGLVLDMGDAESGLAEAAA